MTMAHDDQPLGSRSHAEARQRKLQRTLQSYGVLTGERLREAAGAESWRTPFELTLKRAISAGRVRRLSEDLYEAGPER
jgi:hypothetical protein